MIRIPRLGDWLRLGEAVYVPPNTITYILDMVYADKADDASPITTPLSGRVGQTSYVENDGTWAISSGVLNFTAQTTPAFGDLVVFENSGFSTTAGTITFSDLTLGSVSQTLYASGLSDSKSGSINIESLIYFPNTNLIAVREPGVQLSGLRAWTNTGYQTALILRNDGAFYILDNTMLWVSIDLFTWNPTTTYAVGISNYNNNGSMSLFRVASMANNATYPVPSMGVRDLDLAVPGQGTGTSQITTPAAANTFVHTADVVLEYDYTTMPSAGAVQVYFRAQDANNYWRLDLTSGGSFLLYEVVSGTPTLRGNGTGMAGGEHISVVAVDSAIAGYANRTAKFLYLSASNFISETAGSVNSLGTGGVIANLTARTVDGTANSSSVNYPGDGIATSILPGPRTAGDVFTHEADCIIQFKVRNWPPTSATVGFGFRRQDISNLWRLSFLTSGELRLVEVVGGGSTTRGTIAAGLISATDDISVICVDETIQVIYGHTIGITYSSAANFKTQTTGTYISSNSETLLNIKAWPYSFASAPNTPQASVWDATWTLLGTS